MLGERRKNLNLVATPNKQINPLVSNAFDIELQTGSLTFLESKILIDFKLMLPSQGEEEDDCCLLLFFHKQNNTWEYEDKRKSEPVQRNTTPNDAEEESSLQEDVMEARPGPLDSTNCPIAENSLKDTEPGGPQNGKNVEKSKKDVEDESQKFLDKSPFIEKSLYEETIMTAVKKDITKLLKMCRLKSSGNLISQRCRLIEHIECCLKTGKSPPDEILLFLVKSLNVNGVNMELARLGLDKKDTVKSKKEILIQHLKDNNIYTCAETEASSPQITDEKTKTRSIGVTAKFKENDDVGDAGSNTEKKTDNFGVKFDRSPEGT